MKQETALALILRPDGTGMKILKFIFEYQKMWNSTPAMREVAEIVDAPRTLSTSVVAHYIGRFRKLGLLEPKDLNRLHLHRNVARAPLVFTETGLHAVGYTSVVCLHCGTKTIVPRP